MQTIYQSRDIAFHAPSFKDAFIMLPVINGWLDTFNKVYADFEKYNEQIANGEKVEDWKIRNCNNSLKEYAEKLNVMLSLGFEATESTDKLDEYLALTK